jgi:hypothetical protein
LYGNGFVEEKISESLSTETEIALPEAAGWISTFKCRIFEQFLSSNLHIRNTARQDFMESTGARRLSSSLEPLAERIGAKVDPLYTRPITTKARTIIYPC